MLFRFNTVNLLKYLLPGISFSIAGYSRKCKSIFPLDKHIRFVVFVYRNHCLHVSKLLLQTIFAQKQEDAPDLQKRISGCFRNMSRLFNDPAKAEESLNMLNHLKDANIWKILTSLLDFSTMFSQAWSSRVIIYA